jgi:hypothetical protein
MSFLPRPTSARVRREIHSTRALISVTRSDRAIDLLMELFDHPPKAPGNRFVLARYRGQQQDSNQSDFDPINVLLTG